MAAAGLTGFPVNSVTVVIGYETSDSKIEEVVHQVDGRKCDIVLCQHSIERKKVAKKDEDGTILAYEETGEEVLILKVKYIRGM
jgi:hypothetical protein